MIELLLTDLLPDIVSFDLGQHHVASPFAAYKDAAPLRGEAITLLNDLAMHREQVPDMIAEMVCQVLEQ